MLWSGGGALKSDAALLVLRHITGIATKRIHPTEMSGSPNRVHRIVSAAHSHISIITIGHARTCRWGNMHRRPGRFNRRSWGQALNCRRSAGCITATNGGRLEELFADCTEVFSDRESAEIREDSVPVG